MDIWGNNTIHGKYGLDIAKELEDILVQELSASIDADIIKNLFNKQNIRKAKIEGIKDKIRSSE